MSLGIVGNGLHFPLSAAAGTHIHRDGLDLGVSACGFHGVDRVAVAQRIIISGQRILGIADPCHMNLTGIVHPDVKVQISGLVAVQLQILGPTFVVGGVHKPVGCIPGALILSVHFCSFLHLGEHQLTLVDARTVRNCVDDVIFIARRDQLIGAAGGQTAAQRKGVAGAAIAGILEGNTFVAGIEGKGRDVGREVLLWTVNMLVLLQVAG